MFQFKFAIRKPLTICLTGCYYSSWTPRAVRGNLFKCIHIKETELK